MRVGVWAALSGAATPRGRVGIAVREMDRSGSGDWRSEGSSGVEMPDGRGGDGRERRWLMDVVEEAVARCRRPVWVLAGSGGEVDGAW
ncbi:hypothetical protein GCM10009687_68880 [Asanoa iriomotensis]